MSEVFISVSGKAGSGKSTVVMVIADHLRSMGLTVKMDDETEAEQQARRGVKVVTQPVVTIREVRTR